MREFFDLAIFWGLVAFGLTCIFIALWIRWKARNSRSFFALSIAGALTSVLGTTLASVLFGLENVISTILLKLFGVAPSIGAPSLVFDIVIIVFGMGIAILIYRLGVHTISEWDPPLRVSELKLAEDLAQKNLMALAFNGAAQLLKGAHDPIATDAISDWRKEEPTEPASIERHVILRDLFTTMYTEALIRDDGWRDKGRLWIGQMYESAGVETFPIILLVLEERPSVRDLRQRLNQLSTEGLGSDSRLFAVYLSDSPDDVEQKAAEVDGRKVEIFGSRAMILESLDLQNYARQILQTFNSDLIGGTGTTLARSYVDLSVRNREANSEPRSLKICLDEWEGETSKRHIAITGEYGQGKSSAMLKFCADWAQNFLNNKGRDRRIPLLIELRGKAPAEMDPETFLATWCQRYGLETRQVFNLVRSGGATIIFEGFDELKNAGREYDRHKHFLALWRFAFPGVKMIFTGRPNFFIDDAETNRTLRHSRLSGADGNAFTDVLAIEPMSSDQIAEACRDYSPKVKDGIIAEVGRDESFREIISRPSMLPVVATIWQKVQEMIADGASLTGASVLDLYITAVFERKEAELEADRVIRDAPEHSRYLVLPLPVRLLLTKSIAWQMAERGLQNTIGRGEVTEIIAKLYQNLLVFADSETASIEITEGIRKFEAYHAESTLSDKIEIVTTEICSAGLLVPDPVGGVGFLRFAHKQFFEFLVAEAAQELLNGNQVVSKLFTQGAGRYRDVCSTLSGVPVSCKFFCQLHLTSLRDKLPIQSNISIRVASFFAYRSSKILENLNRDSILGKSKFYTVAATISVFYRKVNPTSFQSFQIIYMQFSLAVTPMLALLVFTRSQIDADWTIGIVLLLFILSVPFVFWAFMLWSSQRLVIPVINIVSWGAITPSVMPTIEQEKSFADRHCAAVQELLNLGGKFSTEFGPDVLYSFRNPADLLDADGRDQRRLHA